jgi:hypothetical protein
MTEIDRTISAARARLIPFQISTTALDTAVIAATAALLSLLHTGFVFGIGNNLFHLPIVAGLYNEPQYHDDAFIQSLRHFSSGVWMLLGNSEKDFDQAEWLFLVLDYLSRLISFVGFLCCGSLLGVERRLEKIVFSFIICFTSFLNGYSFAGGSGMFLGYFTHSEIANGTTLLALYFCARGRLAEAITALGATFFVNAFMAVWLALPLSLMTLGLLRDGKTDLRSMVRHGLIGLIPFSMFALPVCYEIATNPDLGKPLDFDFIAYLNEYFAMHFLFSSISVGHAFGLGTVTLLGAAAFFRLGMARSELGRAFVGAVAVYVIGVMMPYLTHNPQILELHLLRAGGTIHLLAGTAAAALATTWICSLRNSRFFFWGCLFTLLLCASQLSIILCIPIILGTYFLRPEEPSSMVHASGYAVLALLVGFLCPHMVWQSIDIHRQYARDTAEWTSVGNWALKATPLDSIFMIPTDATTEPTELGALTPTFEFVSHRRVWIDFRRGAAVLWTPSYYQTWRSRMNDVARLGSLADRIDYARAKGIGYVIEGCAAATPQQQIVFRSDRLCVFSGKAAS